MEENKIKQRLQKIRDKAYNLKGSYEDSYIYLMNEIDKVIGDLK